MDATIRMQSILNADKKTLSRIDALLEGEKDSPTEETRHDLRLLTWSAAARETGLGRTTLWRWWRDGKLAAIELPGGRYRIARSELQRIIKGGVVRSARPIKKEK